VCEGHCTLTDLLKANRYLTLLFARRQKVGRDEQNDGQTFFPPEVFREFQRVVKTLVREDRIFISGRKLVKLYKVLRVRAWLPTGGTVTRDDLKLLAYLGETTQEMDLLREKCRRYWEVSGRQRESAPGCRRRRRALGQVPQDVRSQCGSRMSRSCKRAASAPSRNRRRTGSRAAP
jgi:AAA lid domain